MFLLSLLSHYCLLKHSVLLITKMELSFVINPDLASNAADQQWADRGDHKAKTLKDGPWHKLTGYAQWRDRPVVAGTPPEVDIPLHNIEPALGLFGEYPGYPRAPGLRD